jgi:hypothetical protein
VQQFDQATQPDDLAPRILDGLKRVAVYVRSVRRLGELGLCLREQGSVRGVVIIRTDRGRHCQGNQQHKAVHR